MSDEYSASPPNDWSMVSRHQLTMSDHVRIANKIKEDAATALVELREVPIQCKEESSKLTPTTFMNSGKEPTLKKP